MAVMLTPEEIEAQTKATPPPEEPPGASDTAPRTVKPKPRDRAPKTSTRARAGRPSTADRTSARTKELGEAAGTILAMPGMVFGMVGEAYLESHFVQTGPAFGMQLAVQSEKNPKLREILEKAVMGDSYAVLILGAVAYLVPPIVYLATPNTSPLRKTFQVPPRLNTNVKRKRGEQDADTASAEGPITSEPDTPTG